MKKLLLILLLGSFMLASCHNRKHGRTGWSEGPKVPTEKVKPA